MIKSSFFLSCAFAMMVMVGCTQAPDSDNATTSAAKEIAPSTVSAESMAVDPSASKIVWVGTKVSGYHSGPVQIKSGELLVQDGKVTGGKFVLDLTTIATTGPRGSQEASNAKLTAHLRSNDFFDVANYPEATFEITSVAPFSGTEEPTIVQDDNKLEEISEYRVTNPTHTISGNLTIKNITKNIQFPAQITVSENAVDATAKFNIDRTQWGIIYPGKPDDLIRNEIHLGIALKATK
jgi:polyisoprenoid-binding protein YceI